MIFFHALPLFVLLVLGPLPKPLGAQEQRAAWRAKLQWEQSYEDSYLETHRDPQGGISIFDLPEGWQLIQVQTYLGLYQPGQVFFLWHPKQKQAQLLRFPHKEQGQSPGFLLTSEEVELNGLVDFLPKTQELRLYARSRGIGGCGHWLRWRLQKRQPELLEVRAMDCDAADQAGENMELNPTLWPRIWPISN